MMILIIIILILVIGARWYLSRNWMFLVPTLYPLHLTLIPDIDIATDFTQVRPDNFSPQLHHFLWYYFPDIPTWRTYAWTIWK